MSPHALRRIVHGCGSGFCCCTSHIAQGTMPVPCFFPTCGRGSPLFYSFSFMLTIFAMAFLALVGRLSI